VNPVDPESYRKKYLEPFPEEAAKKTAGPPDAANLPFLPKERYYFNLNYRHYDNLTLDLLTSHELLEILRQAGLSQEDKMTAACLRAELAGRQQLLTELKQDLAERDREVADLKKQLDSIRGSGAYKVYLLLRPPLRGMLWLFTAARRFAESLVKSGRNR